jgi:LytR cell envelope-related transcriptional attenuator
VNRLRPVVALLALGAAATGLLFQVQRWGSSADATPVERSSVLLVVRLPAGPLMAAVAAGGGRPGTAVTVPPSVTLTVPGQGDGTAADAAQLPGPPAVAAASNLLGVWIPHYAITDGIQLAERIDREGGLSLFGERVSGRGVLSALAAPGRLATWREVVRALLWTPDPWRAQDFTDTDDVAAVERLLSAAGQVEVTPLPTHRIPGGLLEIDDRAAAAALAPFGRRASEPIPVIVLNGSGLPGVGQVAAERLIPAGFRIVSSGNASAFDHKVTLVVASGPDEQGLAVRAQAALGVGRVSVAGVPSGLASVTIVLGKDFAPE